MWRGCRGRWRSRSARSSARPIRWRRPRSCGVCGRRAVSGVLAAVTAGVYIGWQAPRISSPAMRNQGYAVWDLLQFLLNAILFVLIGLQLPGIADGIGDRPWIEVVGLGALMWLTVI